MKSLLSYVLFVLSVLSLPAQDPTLVNSNGENITNPAFRNAVLPLQTGNANKYLKTDGTAATWEEATGDSVTGDAVNTALEEDPALSLRAIQSDGSIPGLKNTLNATGVVGAPLNVSVINLGDSFNVGAAGGVDYVSQIVGSYKCGAATAGGDSGVTSNYAIGYTNSPDGLCQQIASGGNLTCAHLGTGAQGPANRVYYTFYPGTGSAQLQFSDNRGAWTSVGGAIDTTAISSIQIGAVNITTPSQNIRCRVTATGGYVRGWIGQGMSDGGVTYIGFSFVGQDIGQSASISETIWKAMIAGYKHTSGAQIVVNTWADYRYTAVAGTDPLGTETWADGGPMDRLLDWSRVQNSAVDWLTVSAYQVDTGLLDAANATLDGLFTARGIGSGINDRVLDGIVAMREWSIRNQEGFVDCTHLFPDYLEAYDRGIFAGESKSVTSASQAANVVTLTFPTAHGWALNGRGGIRVSGITGSSGTEPNGRFYARATTNTTLTYSLSGAAGTYGGTIAAILEDGIHITALGKTLRKAHIASQSNYRRVFSIGENQAGVQIGRGRIAHALTGFAGLGTTLMIQDDANNVWKPGNVAGNYYFLTNPAYPQTLQGVIYSPSLNIIEVGHVNSGTLTPTLQIRSGNLSPKTNNQGRLGDIGQRWHGLYSGGMTMGYAAVSATYSVLKTDHLIHITSGTFNITIPLAYDPGTGNNDGDTWAQKGRVLIFRNTGAGTATLVPRDGGGGLGLQKIDTTTSLTIAAGETKRIVAVAGNTITAADYGNWITF